MAITPLLMTIGQINPAWIIELPTSSDYVNLAGVTSSQLSLVFYNAAMVQVGTSQGIATVVQNYPGIIQYVPGITDAPLQTAGSYFFKVKVNYNGANPYFTNAVPFTVQN